MLPGAVLTPGAFDMLGVAAARGRTFAVGEGRGGSARVAVVSDALWRERLGRTPDVAGRTLMLNGRPYQVVGVMPQSFRFPSGTEEVWTPFDLNDPAADVVAPRAMTAFGRLRRGVTLEHASAIVRARGAGLNEAAVGTAELTGELMQPGQFVHQRTAQSLWVLSGAVAFLFLIVCANVANLTLSRSLTRVRELATCAALGASPRDLLRVTIFEQLLLAAIGAAGGVGVALGAMRVAVAALPDSMLDGSLNAIDLDGRALLFLLAAGVASVLLFGMPPAIIAARTSVAGVLGRDGRTTTGSRPARRFRGALAIAEVAVSVVLLIGAAVMTRSFIKLASADQGYNPSGLISLRIGLPAGGYRDVALRDLAARDIAERIASLPGVTGVTTGGLPTDNTNMVTFGKTEIDTRPGELGPQAFIPIHEVPPNYFSVLGIPIVAGRGLRSDDTADVMVVNQRLASKYFPSQSAVGHRFRTEGKAWRTIVGVVGDTRANNETGAGRAEFFCPIGAATDAARPVMGASAIADYRTIIIRAPRPDAVIGQLDDAVHERDKSIVIWKVALAEHLLGDAIARPRVVFAMMAVFAGFGLLLAMAGLYGVLSCLVAQRRQELGIRLALGASAAQVRRLVLGNGLSLTGAGVGIGVAASLPLVGAMRSLLYEVNPADPAAIVGAGTVLCATALVASWWPARDAGRIDPVDLLRRD
jgi:predicted permease